MISFEFTMRFKRAYSSLDKENQKRVDKALLLLAENRYHPSLRLKRVKGTDDIWEASASMSIRLTFKLLEDGNIIQLRNVGAHEDVFRPPY
jgi:mRNA-degrading endonuclease YafQ of YafQ-DinJ toxin-antitoxin module